MFEPSTLPCGHSGCLKCLKTLFEGNHQRKKCPICKLSLKINPTTDLRISTQLQAAIQELFPNDYGKKESEVIKIDVTKVVKIVASQLGLCIDPKQGEVNEKTINVNTTLKALKELDTGGSKCSYSLNSHALAYRIWKDYTLQNAAHQA